MHALEKMVSKCGHSKGKDGNNNILIEQRVMVVLQRKTMARALACYLG